jgi:alkylation response protein AidB-like acyl-CoA dehydrogenase
MTIIDTRPADAAHDTTNGGTHWTGASADSAWVAMARSLAGPLAEQAAEHDRTNTFVAEGMALVREHGCMSMLVPAAIGGGGASFAENCALLAELAHGCPATSLTFSMHSHLVAAQVWRHQRDIPAPVLAKVAADQLQLVSTGASDWMESNGTATKVDGGYRVTARKSPASGAPSGNIVVTSARWDDAPDGPQVIHCSVPFTAEGMTIEETWDTMGMRGTGSHTLVFDDVFVPDASVSLVRPAGVWHPIWSVVLGVAMPLIMSTYVGVAETAAQRAIDLVASRRDPLAAAPLVGRMLSRLSVARSLVGSMVADADDLRFDNSLDHASTTLARKTAAADACIGTVRGALEIGGGQAFTTDAGIERLYRDVHGALFHPLPAAQQEQFTGRVALGLAPF